jgi:hypothetical protein
MKPAENLWASVPFNERSIVRAYVNSEQEKDIDHAMRLCARYNLSYAETRAAILREMIAESQALGKAWVAAAGSRPLSPEETMGEDSNAIQRHNT